MLYSPKMQYKLIAVHLRMTHRVNELSGDRSIIYEVFGTRYHGKNGVAMQRVHTWRGAGIRHE
jgi:hypothetical protein